MRYPNTYYTTLGRSFYEDLVPENSVHAGFSSCAFHYLSKKPVRKPRETGLFHSGYVNQGKSDFECVITKRIKELVPGGTLTAIVGARSREINANIARLITEPYKKLISAGDVSAEELSAMEMNTYAFNQEEWDELLHKLKDKVKVLHFNMEKHICPFYLEYLVDKDLKKYQDRLIRFCMQYISVQVNTFINRTEEEKLRLLGFIERDMRRLIQEEPSEQYLEFTTFTIEKYY